LENKQDKTQQEIETLEQLNITYKVTGGGQNAWKDVPVLLATSKQRYTESLNISATHNEDEILELKKQIQLLKQERSTFESQAKQLPPLKQEESNLQRQIKERDRQQGANEMVDTLKSLLQSKKNEIELNNLKMENALDKEKGKVKKLLKEIKKLKQQQTVSSWEARPSSSTTVPESTASNIGTNEDDPNNDFNYDTECGAKNSNTDDTSSEDNANDLNYDSDV
jgi:hypothetical protein